jgi:hypothetical protein
MLMVLVWEFPSVFHCQVDHLDFIPTHTEHRLLSKELNGDTHKTPDNHNSTKIFLVLYVIMCISICIQNCL